MVREALTKEILETLDIVSGYAVDSKEYTAGVDALTKLIDKLKDLEKIDAEKVKNEREYEIEEKKLALENTRIQMDLEKAHRDGTDQKVKNILTAAGIVIPTAVAIWANVYNWYKENGGIMSSTGGRNAISTLTKVFRH